MHLRNAPTKSMKEWGYGEGYQHAHKFENAIPDMPCLPASDGGRHGISGMAFSNLCAC